MVTQMVTRGTLVNYQTPGENNPNLCPYVPSGNVNCGKVLLTVAIMFLYTLVPLLMT